MATLSGMGKRGRRAAFLTAVRFAIGHAAVLGGIASLCLLAGVGLSEGFETWAEIFGGAVLVALSITAFFFPTALQHGHPHLPGHEHSHSHARVATAAGALMAVSGVRSLLLSVPALVVGGTFSLSAWLYLPGFALGILLGMGAVGMIFAASVEQLSQAIAERLHRIVALGSAALGLFWIVARI